MSQGVLVVPAVRDDGLRKIVAIAVADTEGEVTYRGLVSFSKRWELGGRDRVGRLRRPRGLKGGDDCFATSRGLLTSVGCCPLRQEPPQDTVSVAKRKEIGAEL